MNTLYLAYGSNLNIKQMAHRCPTAKLKGTTFLNDYKLLFRGRHGGAVATVEPCKDSKVPVMIWQITEDDEKSLDIYEGYPNLYRKEMVKVKLDKKNQEVMMYVMNDGRPIGMPSRYYYDVIAEGYHNGNFDINFLESALDETARMI